MNENSNEIYDLDNWLEEQIILYQYIYVQLCYNHAKNSKFHFVCRILRDALVRHDILFNFTWDTYPQ